MTRHFDSFATRDPKARATSQFAQLRMALSAACQAPAYAAALKGIDPRDVTDAAALSKLPILRKSDLPAFHSALPPFGGFVPAHLGDFGRLFTSPGPIFEPEGREPDPWGAGRACFAAGFQCGDVALNTFSYHLTPGGFILDSGARAAGCAVIPAGPGNTEQQLELIGAYQPAAYCGTPDFLKILIEAGDAAGKPVTCLKKALVSGAAFPPSLQEWVKARGINAYQAYATADVGVIAYETSARDGLVVNEHVIVEIVRPGTGEPVAIGEVGEVVVTSLNSSHPVIRLAVGDLSALLPGSSPCGRTNARIKGWMGRADQTAKIKGMFVRPEQVAEIGKRHPELGKLRLEVTRAGETDAMVLKAECASSDAGLAARVVATLQAVTKLKGSVELCAKGSLPNDGKVIADERPVG
jgi:phenylacetate-CoA ligase